MSLSKTQSEKSVETGITKRDYQPFFDEEEEEEGNHFNDLSAELSCLTK